MPDNPVHRGSTESEAGSLRTAKDLAVVQRRLHKADSIRELFVEACTAARAVCGFDRVLILAVEDHQLTASALGVMGDPGSDGLRRQVLTSPIPILSSTAEFELIRQAEGGRGAARVPSAVATALGLRSYKLAPIRPDERVLALLVVDREDVEVTPLDADLVDLFAHLVSLSVERLFLRLRLRELQEEFRHLTASAMAAVQEAVEAPVTLPRDYGSGAVFATPFRTSVVGAPRSPQQLEQFTEREQQIAEHLIAGRSNREIALEMHLSPETVKGYVARLVRKLGASNRVDAVSRYLRQLSDPDS